MKDDPEIFKRTRDSDNAATEPRLSTAGLASPRRSAGKSVADALRGGAVSPRDARNLRQAHAEERMADDAEQRSVEQILALEEELERSRTASASKIQELGKRLSEAEARAIAAEGEIEEARAQVAKLEPLPSASRAQPSRTCEVSDFPSLKPSASWISGSACMDSTPSMTWTTCRDSRAPSSRS